MYNVTVTVTEIDHHRNGISGAPFDVCKFESIDEDGEKSNMLGILFESSGQCAVFDLDKLADGEIRFSYNSFRGDVFEPDLRAAIQEHHENRYQDLLQAEIDYIDGDAANGPR